MPYVILTVFFMETCGIGKREGQVLEQPVVMFYRYQRIHPCEQCAAIRTVSDTL